MTAGTFHWFTDSSSNSCFRKVESSVGEFCWRILLENSVGEFWSLTPQAEFSARLNQKTGTPSKHSTQEAIRQYKIPLASNVAM